MYNTKNEAIIRLDKKLMASFKETTPAFTSDDPTRSYWVDMVELSATYVKRFGTRVNLDIKQHTSGAYTKLSDYCQASEAYEVTPEGKKLYVRCVFPRFDPEVFKESEESLSVSTTHTTSHQSFYSDAKSIYAESLRKSEGSTPFPQISPARIESSPLDKMWENATQGRNAYIDTGVFTANTFWGIYARHSPRALNRKWELHMHTFTAVIHEIMTLADSVREKVSRDAGDALRLLKVATNEKLLTIHECLLSGEPHHLADPHFVRLAEKATEPTSIITSDKRLVERLFATKYNPELVKIYFFHWRSGVLYPQYKISADTFGETKRSQTPAPHPHDLFNLFFK